ncbi:MAG: DUF3093 domain-containing protein [Clostridia bacterium]|nr:DUF3093 domain-containing protein [Clostridia bacterium]
MERRANKRTYAAAAIIIAVLLAVFSLLFSGAQLARAAVSSSTSDVLADLQKDESFKASDYLPSVSEYKFKVIQIAESTEGELLIYVYQPSIPHKDLRATSINIARTPDNSFNLSYDNYRLTFLNSSGVFFKYKVEGFELSKDVIRYYNISNILRPFNYVLDELPSSGQTISETPNAVGQLWTVITANGETSYNMTYGDVIEITQKYVGFLEYVDGVDVNLGSIHGTHTLRNFVAFSTNRKIDKLKQAELKYSLQDVSGGICANPFCTVHGFKEVYEINKGVPVEQAPVTIEADKKTSNITHGILSHSYTWDNIQTTKDFLADENNKDYKLNGGDVADFKNTQWVLNFYNDVAELSAGTMLWEMHVNVNFKAVSDVIILRLTFEENGQTYNLGVVDNKQTGANRPINTFDYAVIPWWVWLIVAGVAVIVILILIGVFAPQLLPVIGKAIAAIFKGLWWLISAPFRAIASAIKNSRERKQATAAAKARTGKSTGAKAKTATTTTTAKGGKK